MPHPSRQKKVSCAHCGDVFEKAKSDAERTDNHFCNRDCFNEWHTNDNNHQFDSAKVTVSCNYCGEDVERYRSELSEQNFCSKECHHESMKKKDYECRFYNTSRWENVRNQIIERDGGCKWCGSENDLHVHHLRPVSEGGKKFAESNLVTLCQQCHVVAHQALKV